MELGIYHVSLIFLVNTHGLFLWKTKKGVTLVNAFQNILEGSKSRESKFKGRKPNKIWIDQGIDFYDNPFKKWLKKNFFKEKGF